MLIFSLCNYSTNFKNNFLEAKFYFIKKKVELKLLKIKFVKNKILLNIKQAIFLNIFNNTWKKIKFINLQIKITKINNKIVDNIDGLLKLNIISLKILKPNCLNLNNLFINLKNIVWTNIGFYELNDFFILINKKNISLNQLIIESIDKIPFLSKYLVINNVRISNTNRVRLGAYLCSGTTIMSEGYVNFNTFIGKNCMIEGRVSSGVSVFNNTDIGGSSSIMGTLSGGGNNIISIGDKCLLGANSGIGISLGNNCIVEAGLYITSGTKIFFLFNNKKILIKANKLSFKNNIIFFRNSVNGKVECLKTNFVVKKTNIILHKN
ncbi:tetrahydrodipicolinate N-succinyltransferase [Candidatus Carsonella ruddii PV]|uniref:Tetrahydrodipicolinate N-succinyltransferase n=1 Tax=Carsonella ruddii (strain PV) TaxID=387662 RepID=Q05FX2_CARRP|nr:DapH/DapD/GlmU-related protein [Candidatus Carsonella ruddii]BAF35049.1 tetrahydrodipicolinate N-succinyltransferase [Candidatus Carsonella ruddii PV]